MNETIGNSATLEKTATFIRETSNIQKGDQKQQQELTTRSLATAAETIGITQTTTTKGRPATAGMPEIVEMPPTVIASDNKLFFLCFYFILHNYETYREYALHVIISMFVVALLLPFIQ
jgi:hypothetical protein